MCGAPLFIQLGHAVLKLGQHGLGHLGHFLCCHQCRLCALNTGLIRGGQGIAVRAQTLMALLKLAALFFDVALLRGQHLDLLLHLPHAVALLVGRTLGLAQGIFQIRQRFGLLFALCGEHHRLFFGLHHGFSDLFDFHRRILASGAPGADLLLELRQALLYPSAPLDHEADFGLQLAHFGAGLVELALCLVDLIPRGVMRLTDGLQFRLDPAQIGGTGFQVGQGLGGVLLDLGLIGLSFRALQEPQLVLLERGARLQVVVAGRHFSLFLQLFQVGVELAQDVFHPRQVLTGVREPVGGFPPAFLVFGNTGRLLQEQAQFFRLALDDAADGALPDDGVGPGAQPGTQKHVLDIAAANRLVVDVITAVAIPRQHPLDGDFGELAPLAAGAVVAVVEDQLHAGPAGGLAVVGAIEDHVLHGLTAQLGGLGLAQHPAHGIHDVGFSATIGPDHTHQLTGQQEVGGFSERFEAG